MNIAAYCRVSTDHADQRNSLANQIEFFSAYADHNAYHLYRVYADEGISGTGLKKRTEFLNLLEDAKKGQFEMVVVKDVSRFARNTLDFLQSIRTLKSMGINTLFLTANMTTLGDSEFILTIFGAMAQEESANLSRRVKWGKRINAEKGRVPCQIFGYDRVDLFTLRINEEEAAIVREIYRLYLEEGAGMRRISARLNERAVKTKLGYDWAPYAVRRILTNSVYCGIYVNNRYEVADFLTGKQSHRPQEEWLTHERPEWAIVSKENFEQAQKLLAMRQKQTGNTCGGEHSSRYSAQNLFSSLIRCEVCGHSYVRITRHGKREYRYWVCPTNRSSTGKCSNRVKFTEEELTSEIHTYLSGFVEDEAQLSSAAVRACAAELRRERNREAVSAEERERRRAWLQRKRRNYQNLFSEELITMEELKAKLHEIDAAIEELKHISQNDTDETEQDEILTQLKNYAEHGLLDLEKMTRAELCRVIDRISVGADGTVTIRIRDFKESKAFCQVVSDGGSR